MTEFKVDLRWVDGSASRLTDQTKTPDARVALDAYRSLLRREDLIGRPVAARFVVAGRSLYFSHFDKPLGAGRIHPDAPLSETAGRDEAESLARWLPSAAAAREGPAGVAPGARAATETPALPSAAAIAAFIQAQGWRIDGPAGALSPQAAASALAAWLAGDAAQ